MLLAGEFRRRDFWDNGRTWPGTVACSRYCCGQQSLDVEFAVTLSELLRFTPPWNGYISVQQLWMFIHTATDSACIYRAHLHVSLSLAHMLMLTQDSKEKSAAPRPSSVCFLRSGVATAPEICLPKTYIGRVAFKEAMFQDLDNIIQKLLESEMRNQVLLPNWLSASGGVQVWHGLVSFSEVKTGSAQMLVLLLVLSLCLDKNRGKG